MDFFFFLKLLEKKNHKYFQHPMKNCKCSKRYNL